MRSMIHTGQVPPAMIRSKDNASGMPLIEPDVPEWYDPSPDNLLSFEDVNEDPSETRLGRR